MCLIITREVHFSVFFLLIFILFHLFTAIWHPSLIPLMFLPPYSLWVLTWDSLWKLRFLLSHMITLLFNYLSYFKNEFRFASSSLQLNIIEANYLNNKLCRDMFITLGYICSPVNYWVKGLKYKYQDFWYVFSTASQKCCIILQY